MTFETDLRFSIVSAALVLFWWDRFTPDIIALDEHDEDFATKPYLSEIVIQADFRFDAKALENARIGPTLGSRSLAPLLTSDI